MSKITKKLIAFLSATAIAVVSISGCAGSESSTTETTEMEFTEAATEATILPEEIAEPGAEETVYEQTEKPTDEGYGILREASTEMIGSLNPHTYINAYTGDQLKRSSVSLYTYFPNEDYTFCTLAGELASEDPIQLDDEGKVWQINIRDNVTWENGDVIDANDVYYTWKMILDPKMVNLRASNLAKDVIEVEGAMDYFEGNGDWEDVGLKLIDDHTLEIHTVEGHDAMEVMTHLAHPSNCIVNEEYYEKGMNEDRTETLYGTSTDYWISAGPFLVDYWANDAEIFYKKNPDYVFKDLIWLAGIDLKVVEDSSTQLQMFENGDIDYVALDIDTFSKYEEDPRVLYSPANYVRYITVNTINPEQPILANEKMRQALFYSIDREAVGNLIFEEPADYIVPTTHVIDLENGIRFRDTEEGKSNVHENYGYDPEKAAELFEEALEEEGIDSVSITMLYNDYAPYTVLAEYLQQSWPAVLGDKFELKLQAMPSPERGNVMRSFTTDPTCYDISWGSWVSTDLMPWNAFKYWTSYYSSKNEPYYNNEFDAIFEDSNYGADCFDEGVRLHEVQTMEQMLIEPAIIIPISEVTDKYLKADRVELNMQNWANQVEWGWEYAKIVE